jgi:hypothetical protein
MGRRWQHTEGVAARARSAAAAVPEDQRPVLLAAAWLHDIGYSPRLRRSNFHPLDGAWHLRDQGWSQMTAGLVAQHSGAGLVARVLGLEAAMRPFAAPCYTTGPLADALTYADQTTGPDGFPVDVEERLADMLRRHGPESPNARCHTQRAPLIRAAVRRACQRLVRAADDGAPLPPRSPTVVRLQDGGRSPLERSADGG